MSLAIFDLQVTPMLPTKFQVSVQVKKGKTDFQDGGFRIGRISAIYDLQVTKMPSTRINWCRRSRLLMQLLTPHDARGTDTDRSQ